MHRMATRLLAVAVAIMALLLASAPAEAAKRLALVVGNGAYRDAPLRNPPNDARAIAAALRELGFEVIALENADRLKMQRAMLDFGRKLKNAEVGLFYYAGHGMQVRGANYLIPVGAEINHEDEVEVEAIDTNYVVARMGAAGNKFNIVILDACRNNPFERSFRSAQKGLAAITAPTGTLIAYATAPGSVAADGDGANGLYTSALVEVMRQPGLKIEETFKQVRGTVVAKSNGLQTPWESSSLVGDFLFKAAPPPVVAPAPAPVPAPALVAPSATDKDLELAFWNAIKDSSSAEDFSAYLQTYPNGAFARLAEVRVRALKAPAPASANPVAAPAAAPVPTPAPVPAAPVAAAPAPAPAMAPAQPQPQPQPQLHTQTAMVTPAAPGRMSRLDAVRYVGQHWPAIARAIGAHADRKKRDWFDSVVGDRMQVQKVDLQSVEDVSETAIRVKVVVNFARHDFAGGGSRGLIRDYTVENKAPDFRVLDQRRGDRAPSGGMRVARAPAAGGMPADQAAAHVKQNWAAIRQVLLADAERHKAEWYSWKQMPDMIEAKNVDLLEVRSVAPDRIELVGTFTFDSRGSSYVTASQILSRLYVIENKPGFAVIEQRAWDAGNR